MKRKQGSNIFFFVYFKPIPCFEKLHEIFNFRIRSPEVLKVNGKKACQAEELIKEKIYGLN